MFVLFLLGKLNVYLMESKHCVLIAVRKLILLWFLYFERSRPVTFHVLKLKSYSCSLSYFHLTP